MQTKTYTPSNISIVVALTLVTTSFGNITPSFDRITVTSGDDNITGTATGCTLRDAIIAANTDDRSGQCPAGNGADDIEFERSISSIALQAELPTITDALTIEGPGADQLEISAGGASRIVSVAAPGDVVAFRRITLTGGNGTNTTSGIGGAIEATAFLGLTFEEVRFTGNTASIAGGALSANPLGQNSYLVIENSEFIDNAILSNSRSGGGAVHIRPSTTSNPGRIQITKTSFVNNQATRLDQQNQVDGPSGGAVWVITGGSVNYALDIETSTFNGNRAFSSGGAISIETRSPSPGGPIPNINITNSTFVSNVADSNADEIGDGGGIFTTQYAPAIVTNTIIANNRDLSPGTGSFPFGMLHPDVSGYFRSGDHNFIGDSTGSSSGGMTGFSEPADQVGGAAPGNIRPGIRQLERVNGSFGQIHRPRRNGRVADKGNCSASSTDQRGARRPRDLPGRPNAVGGNGCDIGAVEAN